MKLCRLFHNVLFLIKMDLSSIYILHNQDDDQIELLFEIWLLYIKIDLLIYLYMYYSDILIKRV